MKQLIDMRYDNLGHVGQGIFHSGLCHGLLVYWGCKGIHSKKSSHPNQTENP